MFDPRDYYRCSTTIKNGINKFLSMSRRVHLNLIRINMGRFMATVLMVLILPLSLFAQDVKSDSLLTNATLENVVNYAIAHQPLIQQAIADQDITNATIKTKLADWYPQINFNYNLTHNFELQPNFIPSVGIARLGIINTSLGQFAATQNLFNRDIFLASKTASEVRLQALQKTSSSKIDIAVNVTKAFYDVLSTAQQIKLGKGDIVRLNQSLKTAHDQYDAGIVDKTDFKRAQIALNNTEGNTETQ